MPELEVSHVTDGTIYFKKAKKRNVRFKATIQNIMPCLNGNGRPFTALFVTADGSEKIERWTCFDREEAEKAKKHSRIVIKGIYFGPFKKQVLKIEVKGRN